MKTKTKVFIILMVTLLSLMALVIPRYNNSSAEFHVTNSPLVAFQDAQKSDKPIFLEFYAKW